MIQSINFPLCTVTLAAYGGWGALRRSLDALGIDGIEGIWGGEAIPADLLPGMLQGYHLTFTPDWLDFYRWDTAALCHKFGSLAAARAFYGGGPETLLEQYRADLARAMELGAHYVVFHVSDVSIEEGYTVRWFHSDEAVIDASVELINALLDGVAPDFDFLVENQWWPGFTFTDPKQTERLLDAIPYEKAGIMLDTGHLMNACTTLRTQAEGAAYILRIVQQQGSLAKAIRGVHLHQSLSGEYVQAHTGRLPDDLPQDYIERFCASYAHILQIDRHQPWTDPAICPVLEQINPAYLTHELAASSNARRMEAVKRQTDTLKRGGFLHDI